MKKLRLTIAILLGVVLLSVMVSAQSLDLERGAEQITEWIQDIFGPFFAALLKVSGPEYLFAKTLLAILLLIVVYIILDKTDLFGDNQALIIIISIIISLTSVRYLPEETFIEAIILPYNVLGVALLSLIPLIIYFFFVENINDDIMRKIAWALYAAIFIGLCITRLPEIGDIAYIYLLAAIFAILAIIFDKTIRTHVLLRAMKEGWDSNKWRQLADLEKEIDKDRERYKNAKSNKARKELKKLIKKNKKKRKELAKM